MGNGLDIGPNGYGPRFRPGLNYPGTAREIELEEEYESRPPRPPRWDITTLVPWLVAALFVALLLTGFPQACRSTTVRRERPARTSAVTSVPDTRIDDPQGGRAWTRS